MPSPFPGMDPYLETHACWPDLLGSLIAALRLDLNARLPDRYYAALVPPNGQRCLRVYDHTGNRLVSVVEFLTPWNKCEGPSREAFLAKRHGFYPTSGVNMVEIDLLRIGSRPPVPDPSAYYVLVNRGTRPEDAGFWPIALRDRLPDFPLPLDAEEPDLLVSLQRLLDGCYDGGRFSRRIDYTNPPHPPLAEPDAAWARELLAARLLPDSGTTR